MFAKIEPIGNILNLTMNTGKVQIVVDKLIDTESIIKLISPLVGICFFSQKLRTNWLSGYENTKIPTVESTVNQRATEYTAKGLLTKIITNANPIEFRLSASLSKSLLIITRPTSKLARITDTPKPVIAE